MPTSVQIKHGCSHGEHPGLPIRAPVACEVDPEKSAFVVQIVDNPVNNTVIMLAGLVPPTPWLGTRPLADVVPLIRTTYV